MKIYFDHASAQLPDEENIKVISENLQKYSANAENRHFGAYAVRQAQNEALKKCISALDMQLDANAVFFSSGSEIFRFLGDFLNTLPTGNIIANAAMHPAFIAMLKRTKHEVRMVKFNTASELDIDDLKEKCDKNTRLFAHFHVHSETGLISDIENLRKTVKNINPEILFFADTIQSFCKIPLPKADLWTASGHKIGIAASAALFYRKNSKYDFERIVFDYRHEDYLMGRPESSMIISMLECAAKYANIQNDNDFHFKNLQKVIRENLPHGVTPTFPFERIAPHILHLQMPPFDGAVVAGLLSERGIAVSPGSACTAEAKTPSAALKALNIKNPYSVLRLSFAAENTVEECKFFCKILQDVLKNY
ncbi:MAG: aminotransferase class V-fold PLP-dependent enzyme [Lentisphaeria bacterium]|nr:aminotransferase class V-fold PLP-dependent enzyme [Lentisphaeria bacterium]